jgi:hypothetical protein
VPPWGTSTCYFNPVPNHAISVSWPLWARHGMSYQQKLAVVIIIAVIVMMITTTIIVVLDLFILGMEVNYNGNGINISITQITPIVKKHNCCYRNLTTSQFAGSWVGPPGTEAGALQAGATSLYAASPTPHATFTPKQNYFCCCQLSNGCSCVGAQEA